MEIKTVESYKKSYNELVKKILLDLDVLSVDIKKGMAGVFIATKRARVKSIEIAKLLKEYRERSADETRKLKKGKGMARPIT